MMVGAIEIGCQWPKRRTIANFNLLSAIWANGQKSKVFIGIVWFY